MKVTKLIEHLFNKYLPSPLTIAILLTLFTVSLALLFTKPEDTAVVSYVVTLLGYWESGIWNTKLLEFAYQMMLILVLGHVLVLSKPISNAIVKVTRYCTTTASSAAIVASTTMLVAFFNWGLGLIFGALLARKVAEHAQRDQIALNYPIVGAAGYLGLMVWHGGISGSAPIKINESGHISSMMSGHSNQTFQQQIPDVIDYGQTIFSVSNLLIFAIVVTVITGLFYFLGKRAKPTPIELPIYQMEAHDEVAHQSDKLDTSRILAYTFGLLILVAFAFQYYEDILSLKITPNLINFFMLGLGILLHGNFRRFGAAISEAIGDVSGILIQFPLYFGIMGVMSGSGMVTEIATFFVSISTPVTLPIFTFFSAGLVNIFVPSGGGQWVVQGPVVIESALQLGVPLPKAIMALAYGDQVTNMLQPFWALPLLGITRLKAKQILPYTLIAMVVASFLYIIGLLLF